MPWSTQGENPNHGHRNSLIKMAWLFPSPKKHPKNWVYPMIFPYLFSIFLWNFPGNIPWKLLMAQKKPAWEARTHAQLDKLETDSAIHGRDGGISSHKACLNVDDLGVVTLVHWVDIRVTFLGGVWGWGTPLRCVYTNWPPGRYASCDRSLRVFGDQWSIPLNPVDVVIDFIYQGHLFAWLT